MLGLNLIQIKVSALSSTEAAIINSVYHTAFVTYGVENHVGGTFRIKLGWMKNAYGIGSPILGAYILSK